MQILKIFSFLFVCFMLVPSAFAEQLQILDAPAIVLPQIVNATAANLTVPSSQVSPANITASTQLQNSTASKLPEIANATIPEKHQEVITPNPYSTEISVAGYGDDERQQAFNKALVQIMVASGVPMSKVTVSTGAAAEMVQSYSYDTRKTSSGEQLFLRVQFDREGIDKAIRGLTQPVWATKRPITLVWLAMVYSPFNKALIDESSNDVLAPALMKNAANYGMPVTLPELDLQDTNRVKIEDICNQNAPAIKAGSERYGVASILSGCIIRPLVGNSWVSHWVLVSHGKTKLWNLTGTSAEDVLSQAMSTSSQVLGNNTIKKDKVTPQNVVLRISGIQGLDQYNEVVKNLRSLSPVLQVDSLNVGTSDVLINVSCLGGKEALLTALNAQSKLVPNTDNQGMMPPGVDLDYRLAGSTS